MPLRFPIYNRQKNSLINKRSQSALEYMMTYGWAILIIVIVAAVLYSFGIFSPSSSISATITGFSGLGSVQAECVPNAGLQLQFGNSLGYLINVTSINITSVPGLKISPGVVLSAQQSDDFFVPYATLCSSGSRYSVSVSVAYTKPGSPFPGPYYSQGTISSRASTAGGYVPLTITNTQLSATPAPFQQMFNLSISSGAWYPITGYISSTYQNVMFFTSGGAVISSWLENYSSSQFVYWLKLDNGIPASSSVTAYMVFYPKSDNVLNTVNTGEAPQLSSTYAEYDDGANVFTDYWNFAGTTLPSEFSEVNAGGTITVNNGLNISMSSNWGTYIISKTTFSDNEIFGSYFKSDNINTASDAGASLIYSTSSNLGGSQYAATQYGNSGSYTNFVYNYANGVFPWNAIGQVYTYPTNTFYFYIIGITSSGTFGNGWINNVPINSANSNQLETSGYIALQQTQQTGIFQYVFVGAYPPNGVMPPVTFGSVS